MTKAQRIYREARKTLAAGDARYLTLALLQMTVAQAQCIRDA
jgi:hypothetical protein